MLFWVAVARASVADALPLAKGVRLGLYTTLTFLLLVWPGLILAICNFATRIALVLVGLAAAIPTISSAGRKGAIRTRCSTTSATSRTTPTLPPPA